MTIVEFFDGVSIDNMASCLAIRPEKIIFIGENKPMKKQEEAYLRFINSHSIKVGFDFKPINKNSVEQIVSALTEIVEEEENCAFDLTGGEDLVLVAMGIVFEKYRNTSKIQMHRFNIRTGMIVIVTVNCQILNKLCHLNDATFFFMNAKIEFCFCLY